jgi:hypothetical protein
MEDIVVRLRGDLDMLSSSQMHALGDEAAAEIERLRNKVVFWQALRRGRPAAEDIDG